MNKLEIALLDDTGVSLDLYLEDTKTFEIMEDIEDIRRKAMLSTSAGEIKEKLMNLIEEM